MEHVIVNVCTQTHGYAHFAGYVVREDTDALGFRKQRVYVYALEREILVYAQNIIHEGDVVEIAYNGRMFPVRVNEINRKTFNATGDYGDNANVYCTRIVQRFARHENDAEWVAQQYGEIA